MSRNVQGYRARPGRNLRIKQLYRQGLSLAVLALRFGTDAGHIRRIVGAENAPKEPRRSAYGTPASVFTICHGSRWQRDWVRNTYQLEVA